MKNKGHALRAHCIDWLSMSRFIIARDSLFPARCIIQHPKRYTREYSCSHVWN